MKVFVTGGTGAIGGYAVPALIRAGHLATALARTPQKAAVLAEQGARPVSVSLFDPTTLAHEMLGHDAVVNLATAMPSTLGFVSARAWRHTARVRAEGSAAVTEAALNAGVARLVQESVAMVYRDQGASWIDETSPVDTYRTTAGNHAAEANTHRFGTFGGRGVVLRFGLFYGRGAAHSEHMLELARRGIGTMLGRPDSYVSSIHLADAATAVERALRLPAGVYNVVDDEPLTKRAYCDALTHAAGRAPWLRGPGGAGRVLGERLTSLTRSLRVSNARLRAASDWVPSYPSASDGWAAELRKPG